MGDSLTDLVDPRIVSVARDCDSTTAMHSGISKYKAPDGAAPACVVPEDSRRFLAEGREASARVPHSWRVKQPPKAL